jgi:hypothetical protein
LYQVPQKCVSLHNFNLAHSTGFRPVEQDLSQLRMIRVEDECVRFSIVAPVMVVECERGSGEPPGLSVHKLELLLPEIVMEGLCIGDTTLRPDIEAAKTPGVEIALPGMCAADQFSDLNEIVPGLIEAGCVFHVVSFVMINACGL